MRRNAALFVLIAGCGLLVAGCNGRASTGPVPFHQQVAEAQKETDTELRAKRLIKIGFQQGKARDMAGAEETLRTAEKDCQAIGDASGRAGALALLAEAYAGLEKNSAAAKALQSASAAVAAETRPEHQARGLARLARAQCLAGNVADATASLGAAEILTDKVDDVQGRTLVFCAIADAWHRLSRSDQRDRVYAAALEVTKSGADPKKRSVAIAEIAVEQAGASQRGAAAKNFQLALDAAGQIDEPYFRAYALGEIAQRLSIAGFHAKAHETLDTAERAVKQVPHQDMQMQALERVRSLMSKLPAPQ